MVEGSIQCPNCKNFEITCMKMKCVKDNLFLEYTCSICETKFIYDNNGFIKIGEI